MEAATREQTEQTRQAMLESGGNLLLIEHDPVSARSIADMLVALGAGVRVEHADSLSTGLARLAAERYDAVLLDLLLPDVRGLDAFERIQTTNSLVPVVILSRVDDEVLALQAVRAGAQDYLVTDEVDSALLGRSLRYAIERQKGEEELRISRERTRALLDAIPDAIFRIHRDGRVLDYKASKDASSAGFQGNVVGASIRDLMPVELAERYLRHIQAALELDEVQLFEYEHRAQQELRHYEARLVASGAEEALAIVRDVTRSRHLEEQLQLSRRLEAVGRLAGGLAHDFNNILTVIAGNADLALSKVPKHDEARRSLRQINETAERAATLTRQLLAFSRRQVLKPIPLDLNALVADTAKMLHRLIGEDIELHTHLQSEFSTIRADPAQVQQILMNLAFNARDAMPNGGDLRFETSDVDVYETYAEQAFRISSGSYVALVVSDTGVGMDARTRAMAFEPFFTTKERGKGTGLGLSSVYGIVKQSGGYIWLYSEPGVGTAVKIYLPSLDAQPATPPVPERSEAAETGGGETVLLVEDDPQVLEIARRFLVEGGYRVIPARDIDGALERVENPSEHVDLLATDVVLPGMSGRDLAEKLRSVRPGIKTLYLSGYTEEAIARHGVLEEGVAFLEKPYTRDALLAAVRRALLEE